MEEGIDVEVLLVRKTGQGIDNKETRRRGFIPFKVEAIPRNGQFLDLPQLLDCDNGITAMGRLHVH